MQNGDREFLNSWKEIADYMGRGVRTVQRWERDMQLPVRRPRGKQRSAVVALKHEIDAWMAHRPYRTHPGTPLHPHESLSEIQASTARLQMLAERLLQSTKVLKQEMNRAVTLSRRRGNGRETEAKQAAASRA